MLFVLHSAVLAASLLVQSPAAESFPASPTPTEPSLDLKLPRAFRVAKARGEVPPASDRKPWIGVSLRQEDDRVAIASVLDGSPAAAVGLKSGDQLLSIDGKELASYDDLKSSIKDREPGSTVKVRIARGLQVELETRGEDEARPRMGVMLEPRSGDEGATLVVSDVEEGGPAARAGLRAGDELLEIEGRHFEDSGELLDFFQERGAGNKVDVRVARELKLKLGAQPAQLESKQPSEPGVVEIRPEGSGRGRVEVAPREPDAPDAPRVFKLPSRTPAPDQADLREELHRLASDLRDLRNELRELREELESLRSRR